MAEAFPTDEERPPIPKWIEKGITHDERISSNRAKAYPLLVMSNHGRWRVHAQCDDIPWTKETVTGKVRGWDGYWYEPCWMHPSDAEARGIKNGDIVKVYNERGGVLCGALVWERIMPGVLSIDHGARADYIIPEKLDRGGAINYHRSRGAHVEARCRPGHQRLPGRGGAGQHGADGRVEDQVSRSLRARLRPRLRSQVQQLGLTEGR